MRPDIPPALGSHLTCAGLSERDPLAQRVLSLHPGALNPVAAFAASSWSWSAGWRRTLSSRTCVTSCTTMRPTTSRSTSPTSATRPTRSGPTNNCCECARRRGRAFVGTLRQGPRTLAFPGQYATLACSRGLHVPRETLILRWSALAAPS